MLASKILAASGGVSKLYSDDVFQSYTRTGTGADVTVTTNIDMTKGYMLWSKGRSGATDHALYTSALGVTIDLVTNTTAGTTTQATGLKAVSATGHTVGTLAKMNTSSATYVDWVLRNADKFYNHTTVVKSGGSNATVSFANLTTLGMVRVKRTDAAGSWYIWHRSLSAGQLLIGETTAAAATLGHITVSGTTVTLVNGTIADGTYLVEGFAHDTGPDGLIQCGSYTGNGSATGPVVTLGYEPQYLLIKDASAVNSWYVMDQMRNIFNDWLVPNTSAAEVAAGNPLDPTATGFEIKTASGLVNTSGNTYIYLAIRRPNKPPTTGTQVYNAIARTGTGAAATVTGVGFAPDVCWAAQRDGASETGRWDRLRGGLRGLRFNTDPELVGTAGIDAFTMDGVNYVGATGTLYSNTSGLTYINHFFKRAPGVLSQICYSGTGANKTESHDLGVAPELWLVKGRSGATQWVWGSSLLANTEKIVMPTPAGKVTDATAWNSTYPTSTVLSLGTAAAVNTSAATYTAYLWATLAGVSKVFAYTGDGTSGKVINCGFTTGARFVMIVRTSAAGSVFIWDTARGIVAGNDPHLCLDTTAAEVTTDDSIDPDTSGFAINQVAATNINVNGATYIGLAYS